MEFTLGIHENINLNKKAAQALNCLRQGSIILEYTAHHKQYRKEAEIECGEQQYILSCAVFIVS